MKFFGVIVISKLPVDDKVCSHKSSQAPPQPSVCHHVYISNSVSLMAFHTFTELVHGVVDIFQLSTGAIYVQVVYWNTRSLFIHDKYIFSHSSSKVIQ
jgi:hypothetical protein